MTDWDPNNLDPWKNIGWVLRHHWWWVIPLPVGVFLLVVLAYDRWGQTGKVMVQAGGLVCCLAGLAYQRRAKRKKAEAEAEQEAREAD